MNKLIPKHQNSAGPLTYNKPRLLKEEKESAQFLKNWFTNSNRLKIYNNNVREVIQDDIDRVKGWHDDMIQDYVPTPNFLLPDFLETDDLDDAMKKRINRFNMLVNNIAARLNKEYEKLHLASLDNTTSQLNENINSAISIPRYIYGESKSPYQTEMNLQFSNPNIGAYYSPIHKYIAYRPDTIKKSAIHEMTHASHLNAAKTKIKKIIKDLHKIKPINLYYDNPDEIYARLMQLREHLNIDPNKKWTIEEIQDLQDKQHKTLLDFRLDKFSYPPEILLQFFNDVAHNNSSENISEPLYAKKGNKLIPKHQTPFLPLDVDERSDHRIEVQQTYEPIPYYDHGTIRDLGGSPSKDTRSSAERNKDYWHPIKGSWERFKTDWNAGRHPIQGLAKTFGTAILTASAPAAGKALIFNPLGSVLGFAGGVAGSKVGEQVDKKLGVDNLFSVVGGITGGIKSYKYGTKATKRALEIAMRTNGGEHEFNGVPIQLNKDNINYILTGNKLSLQNIVNKAAKNWRLYQGFTVNAKSPSEVPLELDPISNYLYGTKPGWAKVVDGDDLGVHSEYVKTRYPNKKVRVFEVEPDILPEQRVSFEESILFNKSPKEIYPTEGSFRIKTPSGESERFDASGHLVEIIPKSHVYKLQDIWKFNPDDYMYKYASEFTPITDKLKMYYGTGLLDYHGTPFITRTPWLKTIN